MPISTKPVTDEDIVSRNVQTIKAGLTGPTMIKKPAFGKGNVPTENDLMSPFSFSPANAVISEFAFLGEAIKSLNPHSDIKTTKNFKFPAS